MWTLGLAALASILGGCSTGAALSVDVRTDFVPGVELAGIETRLARGGAMEGAPVTVAITPGEDVFAGVRAAAYEGLAPGPWSLAVALLDRAGRTLASRPVELELESDHAVTVLMTRDCRGVTCSGGSPRESACLGGRCVNPGCTVEHAEACPAPECTTDADCDGADPCARARCTSGACLFEPIAGSCAAGSACVPVVGCLPIPADRPDAGSPPDAATPDVSPPADAAVSDTAAGDRDGAVDAAADAGGLRGFTEGCSAGGGGVCASGICRTEWDGYFCYYTACTIACTHDDECNEALAAIGRREPSFCAVGASPPYCALVQIPVGDVVCE